MLHEKYKQMKFEAHTKVHTYRVGNIYKKWLQIWDHTPYIICKLILISNYLTFLKTKNN